MGRCLGRSHRVEGGRVAVQERAARGGQHEAPDLPEPPRAQRLVDRGVFTVDRQDLRARRGGQPAQQRAGGDHRLLVRERQVGAGGKGRRGGLQTGRADDRRQDQVEVAVPDRVDQGRLAPADARAWWQVGAQSLRGRFRLDDDPPRPELVSQLREPHGLRAPRRQHAHLEPVRMPAGHGKGRLTDRAGGAEHGQPSRAHGRSDGVAPAWMAT